MRKKAIEKVAIPKTRKTGIVVIPQWLDTTLILDIFYDRKFCYRYCMAKNGEHAVCSSEGYWGTTKFSYIINGGPYVSYQNMRSVKLEGDEKGLEDWLKEVEKEVGWMGWSDSWYDCINSIEYAYDDEKRTRQEQRRLERVKTVMEQIPPEPDDLTSWFDIQMGRKDYAFWNKDKEIWKLTCCNKSRKRLVRKGEEKKVRHGDTVVCPCCKKTILIEKRRKFINPTESVLLFQDTPVGGVMRYFDVGIIYRNSKEKTYWTKERVRILLNQLTKRVYWCQSDGRFDNKSNTGGIRDYNRSNLLYAKGVEKALNGTEYSKWGSLLSQLDGKKPNGTGGCIRMTTATQSTTGK